MLQRVSRCMRFMGHLRLHIEPDARRHTSYMPDFTKHYNFIKQNTEVSRDHLTPELNLYLVTPNTPLWKSREGECPVDDPFWAFYWPGGQALTRYILDNPGLVHGKRVLDVGSGCGASAIAAVLSGAEKVVANDIDLVAVTAIALNAELNNVELDITTANMIGRDIPDYDVVLLGDMLYDGDVAPVLTSWIWSLQEQSKVILIGDPGRLPSVMHPIRRKFQLLASCELPDATKEENYGLLEGFVWGCNHDLDDAAWPT